MSERFLLTRRQLLLYAATNFLIPPVEKIRDSRSVYNFYRQNGLLGIRGVEELSDNHPVKMLHEQNQNLRDRLVPTPSITEGWATIYGVSAISYQALIDNYLLAAKSDQKAYNQKTLLILGKAMHEDPKLNNLILSNGIKSGEFTSRFEEILNEYSIDGVLAAKMPPINYSGSGPSSDHGRVYEISIWDNLAESWSKRQKAIVLDIANLRTFSGLRYSTNFFENFQDQSGEQVQLPWVCEISTELIEGAGLVNENTSFVVRMEEIKDGKPALLDYRVKYPDYIREKVVKGEFISLAGDLSKKLKGNNVESAIQKSRAENPKFFIQKTLANLGLPTDVYYDLSNIKSILQDGGDNFDVGIPPEKVTIHRLLRHMADSGYLSKRIISGNRFDQINDLNAAIFFVERFPGDHSTITNEEEIAGFMVRTPNGQIFYYRDEEKGIVSSDLSVVLTKLINDGQIDPKKRIVMFF